MNSQRLLSWGDDAVTRVWNFQTGECLQVLEGHTEPVRGGFLLSDNRWVSWSEDATLRIWNLESTECLCVLEGHQSNVDKGFLLADGRIVSYNYEDHQVECEIKIWDSQTGECLCTFSGLDAGIIDWCIDDQYVYARTHSRCWRWSWDVTDQPTHWSLDDFQRTHPVIWRSLNTRGLVFDTSTASVTSSVNTIALNHFDNPIFWVSDGEWTVHQGFANGKMVATCWNDIAFLQVYRGTELVVVV